jgi:alpha-L-arabinofuranosidase
MRTDCSDQTIYPPYNWALQYARGRVLNLLIESPDLIRSGMDTVGYIDAAATVSRRMQNRVVRSNRTCQERDRSKSVWEDIPRCGCCFQVLTGNDLKAVNGLMRPNE